MSRFDEEPDGDPHGECALEIARLESQRDQYYKCFLAEQTEHAKALAARDKAESELASLRAEKERAEAERDDAIADATAVRELMNCYNLGGWTDSVSVMQRALKAEAERDAALKDAERYRHIESRVAAVDLGWMFTLTQIPTTTFGEAIDAAIAARKGKS